MFLTLPFWETDQSNCKPNNYRSPFKLECSKFIQIIDQYSQYEIYVKCIDLLS